MAGLLATLQKLPRDVRDTLFLVAVIAWITAPHASTLPIWCVAMSACALVWRSWIAIRGKTLPSRWLLTVLLMLATAANLYSYHTLLGRDAGVTLLFVLLSLKTLEMHSRRDAFVIFFLGFFALLSNFLFSQSLLTAVAMLLGLLGLLTALINAHMPIGRPSLLQAAKLAGSMALLGAPIMVALFVFFPRVAPLWGMPGDALQGRSGLSSNMRVGSVASLALDDSVVMRIRFEASPPKQSDLYFRGPVLSTFDGREWHALQSVFSKRFQTKADLQVNGEAYKYTVTLNPSFNPWLPVLDATKDAPEISGFHASMNEDLQWVTDHNINDIVRFRATSYPAFSHGPVNRHASLQDFLNLPRGFNPRTRELADSMQKDPQLANADTETLVNAVLNRLKTGGYEYTLAPGESGIHSADEFWFDNRRGFCEHIASAFVILMRDLNVPARVVTGYQGGEMNSIDGYWTVRQRDAHAWTEVWMDGRGWVRVDPTSAVAPGRTGTFERLTPPRSVVAQALQGVAPTLSIDLRALWDAANNGWNQWVLNYTESRQFDLMRNLGFTSPDWQDLSYVLIAMVVTFSLGAALWSLWDRLHQDPWLRLLQRARRKLQKAGLDIPDNAPPRTMAKKLMLQQQLPMQHRKELSEWLQKLEYIRYASDSEKKGITVKAALDVLEHEFRKLPWPLTPAHPENP